MTRYAYTTREMFGRPFTYLWVEHAPTRDGAGQDEAGHDGPAVIASGWTGDHAQLFAELREDLQHDILQRDTLQHDTSGASTSGAGAAPGPDARELPWDVAEDALDAYLDGDVHALTDVPVVQRSGEFREHAWTMMRTVPANEPISYADFAALSGRPAAVRAAASACSHNTIPMFVPCHRVIRTDGGLGGYANDVPLKRELLDHESAHAAPERH